jgi:hypothetical protein
MMRASMASMVMYYPERFEAKEMHVVLTSMREAYSTALSSANDSHQALIQWSAAIMSQFKLDNLHLTHVQGHDGTAQATAQLVRIPAPQAWLPQRTLSVSMVSAG